MKTQKFDTQVAIIPPGPQWPPIIKKPVPVKYLSWKHETPCPKKHEATFKYQQYINRKVESLVALRKSPGFCVCMCRLRIFLLKVTKS